MGIFKAYYLPQSSIMGIYGFWQHHWHTIYVESWNNMKNDMKMIDRDMWFTAAVFVTGVIIMIYELLF